MARRKPLGSKGRRKIPRASTAKSRGSTLHLTSISLPDLEEVSALFGAIRFLEVVFHPTRGFLVKPAGPQDVPDGYKPIAAVPGRRQLPNVVSLSLQISHNPGPMDFTISGRFERPEFCKLLYFNADGRPLGALIPRCV